MKDYPVSTKILMVVFILFSIRFFYTVITLAGNTTNQKVQKPTQ